MPETVSLTQVMEPWHDFYLLAGTVSATLMGLLFVSLSIHWDVVLDDSKAHLHAVALEAFSSFLIVSFLSLMMLTPGNGTRPLGTGLVFLGVMRLLVGLRHSKRMWGSQDEAFSRHALIYRAIVVPVAFVVLAGGGYFMIKGKLDLSFALLTAAVFLLLALGARAAWDLLMRVGRLKMKGAQRIS